MNDEAVEANARGLDAMDAGELSSAELHLLRARELAPEWSAPLFNLGLLFKRQRRWPESYRFNLEARRLSPDDEAARWNLGIAATALGEWEQAAAVWAEVGLPRPGGPGPWDYRLGLVPIRVNVEEAPEVVWCYRIDPARAEILNVPTPHSQRRCHDQLLTDGQPVGTRSHRGQEVPVFNEIQVLEASRLATFRLSVRCPSPEDSARLLKSLQDLGLDAEDWTDSVRALCRACSEGRPHDVHDRDLPWTPEREFGVAAPPEADLMPRLGPWDVLACDRVL
ncbi:MAG: tetratricopeptide repeat protein [Candidatus Eremiobacterota bacterium]